jgi:hypothetical protein
MNDDWRLRIDARDHALAHQLSELLHDNDLEHDLDAGYQDRIVVSVDDSEVFCYAGTRAQAEAAEALIRRLAGDRDWQVELELTHWHPVAERWESPDEPLPATADEAEAERADRVADERVESAQQGYPEYEVRIHCGSRGEAGELAQHLEHEGIPNVHRWSYVLIGATDEDSANALAERLRGEAPDARTITVEFNARALWDERPSNPFAVLGGLAGG